MSSRLSEARLAARPTAISTRSQASCFVASFSMYSTTLPSASVLMALTAQPVLKLIPCFFSEVRRRLAMSRSKAGSISLQYSITVTLLPKALKMLANSSPITPPPMMHRRWGTWGRLSISVDVTTPSECAPSMGRNLVAEPVAMMMLGAEYCVPSTSMVCWSTNCALPCTKVIPGVFISVAIPLANCSTIPSLRAMALEMSKCTSPASIPKALLSFSSCNRDAFLQRHFVGIQPSFRQVPPTLRASTTNTCNPALAALTPTS